MKEESDDSESMILCYFVFRCNVKVNTDTFNPVRPFEASLLTGCTIENTCNLNLDQRYASIPTVYIIYSRQAVLVFLHLPQVFSLL